jgi:hypothetical protein
MSMDVNVSYKVLSAGFSPYLYSAYFYDPETHMLGHIVICEKMVARTCPS